MTKRSTGAGKQLCLPLEDFLAERGARSNAIRPLGEIAAEVVKKVGRPAREGGGARQDGPADREGGNATRTETSWGGDGFRAPPRASGKVGLPAITQTVHRTGLTPGGASDHAISRAAGRALEMPVTVFDAEPIHQTGSVIWVDFR